MIRVAFGNSYHELKQRAECHVLQRGIPIGQTQRLQDYMMVLLVGKDA